jgi:hypothetical protein
MGEERGAYRILVGRPEGRRPLGRPRRRWEDNMKMDLQEVGRRHASEGTRPLGRPRRRWEDSIKMDRQEVGWGHSRNTYIYTHTRVCVCLCVYIHIYRHTHTHVCVYTYRYSHLCVFNTFMVDIEHFFRQSARVLTKLRGLSKCIGCLLEV